MTLTPSDMICFTLYTAAQAMQQAYRPLLDPLAITYPQYLVLTALWGAAAPLTVGGIGQMLNLDSSTLTPLLKRLQLAGLVTRNRDAQDERQVRIHLTEAGRAMQARAAHIPGCILARTGMEVAALAQLQSDITALSQRLRADG